MSIVHRSIPFALLVLLAAPARAHEPPRGIGLLWASDAASSPSVIVANRGLVFVDETDAGPRFSLRCCEAYGANIADRPAVFMEPGGALTVGVYNGVLSSGDRGCTFAAGTGLPTTGETLGNLAGAVGMPNRLFVSTRTFSGHAALFQSEDYGRTFTERFTNPTDHQFDVLLVAPSAPERLYAAGRWRDLPNQKLNFVTALSQNLGANWQEQEAALKVAAFAVHPGNADVVFAYQPIDTLETQFRLLRSADRGATFVTALEGIPKPTVIAAAAEADSLWLGVDGKGGLFHSSDAGQHFEKVFVDDVQAVSCLVRRQGRLWMCANLAPNTNGIWYSDDDGFSFQRWMIFEDVRQQVACSGTDANAACARAWYDYDTELHPPGVDAGAGAPLGLNLDAGPRDAGAPGQPVDADTSDGSFAAEGGAADAGVGTDAAVAPLPPLGDAAAPLLDAGPGFDAGGAAAAQDGAVAHDAQAASEAGWPWPPRKRRHADGCNAGPNGSFDALGSWLLGAALVLLSRTRARARARTRSVQG
jgi:hypothetical protein